MTAFGNIQAVTFDVGGTLIRPWPSVGHVYGEVAARHGHPGLQPDMLNRQFADAWRSKQHFDHSQTAWLDLVKNTFAGLLEEARVEEFFPALYDRFGAAEAWRVFDDVEATLGNLRGRGLRLGIISNWDERLRPLLAQLDLQSPFDPIIISVEVGFAKPSPEIFARAAALLRLPPHCILHVGDSPAEDVEGAQSAGLQGILLDRKGTRVSASFGVHPLGYQAPADTLKRGHQTPIESQNENSRVTAPALPTLHGLSERIRV